MLPVIWHRTLITCSAVLGGLVLMRLGPALAPENASTGISLFSAQVGFIPALLLVILAAIPAVILGTVTAATGHPVTGVFAIAVSVAMLASIGGPIDGWMWRSELPSAYATLIAEMLIWCALALAVIAAVEHLRPYALRLIPGALADDPYSGLFDLRKLWNNKTAVSGLISAGIGGLLAGLLIRTTDPGQVNGALFVAFLLGGLLGQTIAPGANPLGVLISPVVAALVGYGSIMFSGLAGSDAVLARWYADGLTGLAQALPIYYISAGIAGAAFGFGLSRNMDHTRKPATTPEPA